MVLPSPSRFAASLALALAAPAAHAGGYTGEQDTLYGLVHQRGPIALSADGRWLARVDAGNVLHRAATGGGGPERTLAVGVPVRELAASRTAQKVALVTEDGCVGVVDFGSGAAGAPALAWRQAARRPDGRLFADPAAWGPGKPAECAEDPNLPDDAGPIAFSSDGRLLATAGGVVDLDARRVVLSRPRPLTGARADTVLRQRFLERDTRLAVVTARLGDVEEGAGPGSAVQGSVWDLASRTLWSATELVDADLQTPQGQFADVLPNGTLLWGDGTRRAAAPGGDLPVDLVAWNATACGPASARVAALQPWQWVSFVADPRGRWIAGMRKVEVTGATDELVVADLATGRTLVQRAFKHELHGLVASADGATLYGVSAPSVRLPGDGAAPQPVGAVNSVGEVVAVDVPQAGLGAPLPAAAWSARPCPVGDEAPDARRVDHSARVFAPAWTMPLVAEQRPGAGGVADAASADCDAWCGALFTMRDGSVWLDKGTRLAGLDPATGRALRTLPTPRSARIDSVPLPAADGFFNGQGDTLSWRPFEAAAGGPARRVVDVRPGYQVLRLERRGATVLAAWVRKPDARTPRDPEGRPVFSEATYVLYDAAGKRLSEVAGREDCEDCDAEARLDAALRRQLAQPCHDERGPLADGLDWRSGLFDSVRAFACGPAPGAAKLVFWDGVDGAPRRGPPPADEDEAPRLVARDGAIGVVRAGRRLHVYDATARKELGQVALAPSLEREAIVVDTPRGMLFVVSSVQEGDARRMLRAYRFR